jgi:capsular exopolysaccharide synthesis family protein
MSQIFDALQRSDSERSGDRSSEQMQPADVLRRAERLEAQKWHTQTAPVALEERLAELDETDRNLPSLETISPRTDALSEIFAQFRPLEVSLGLQSRLVCLTDVDSAAAEAFRLLGVRVRDLRRTRPLKKILITSSIPQEGKSMVAANLAVTLARAKQRVLVLEGDIRRPALSDGFGVVPECGLCEWLAGERDLTSCICYLESAGLWIMPAGRSPQNPLELLQQGKLTALMNQLTEWFDTVIIDSPPVLPLADTSIWMRLADGILLVTRQGVSEKRQLQRGLEAINSQKLIGALLNCSSTSSRSDYYYRPSNITA